MILTFLKILSKVSLFYLKFISDFNILFGNTARFGMPAGWKARKGSGPAGAREGRRPQSRHRSANERAMPPGSACLLLPDQPGQGPQSGRRTRPPTWAGVGLNHRLQEGPSWREGRGGDPRKLRSRVTRCVLTRPQRSVPRELTELPETSQACRNL